jgi:predicted flap endonuclease-1-like 5' DNA nuclease
MAKKKEKAKKARAKMMKNVMEGKGFEVAHKIWLAGVGAYGKAYDAAAEGVGKVSEQSETLFEDLVARGEEIEGDVRARLSSNKSVAKMTEQMNERFSKVGEQVNKMRERMQDASEEVAGNVSKFQEDQRERLEARMERMREALGLDKFNGKAKKAEKFHAKLDELEEQVAALRADSPEIDDKLAARVERLSAEIAAVAGDPKRAKKQAHKVTKTKAKAKPATKPAKAAAEPATDEAGRLTAPVGAVDDLTLIKGVGAVLAERLQKAGIYHYWQLAALKKAQLEALEAEINFPGRATREAWKTQARALAKTVTSTLTQ